jgi:hypothetical protein
MTLDIWIKLLQITLPSVPASFSVSREAHIFYRCDQAPNTFKMKANFLSNPGKPLTYVVRDVDIPDPLPRHAVIQIKTFGLNHTKVPMWKGERYKIHEIMGIGCIRFVCSYDGNEFAFSMKVVALIQGWHRTSYP